VRVARCNQLGYARSVLPRTYENLHCSLASTLEVVGERWTLLVIREAFLGTKRFDVFQKHLGVARNVLADRLAKLVDAGVLERRRYQERPERFEYRLTEKGLDLWPTIVSLLQWGDKHVHGLDARPMVLTHRGCGGEIDDRRICTTCGALLTARDVRAEPGPGASTAAAA
jgi:DNA-binding HxlR family transcriptional regulator